MWHELKRRNVVKVAVAYAVVAWLLVQVVGTVLPFFAAPDWIGRVFMFFVVLGFPISLVIAWAYELTPDGIERADAVAASESITHVTGRKLERVTIGALVLALAFFVFKDQLAPPVQETTVAESAAPAGEPAFEDETDDVLPNSVAVLPFENLSTDPENAFFAAGIHEETLNQLAKLSHLSVMSRTSMLRYANTDLTIPQIADELNVETVLEGSVRYAGGRVRIAAQLIEAETDKHLWSEVYEREFADIFAIQSDIALNIANALNAELSDEEQAAVETIPTGSPEAYELYLQALSIRTGLFAGAANREEAIDLLEQAIEIDPDFALAYARIGRITINQVGELGTEQTADRALEYAAKALSIDPDVGLAYVVKATIHIAARDWDSALAAANTALLLSPNDLEVLIVYSRTYSYLGDHETAIRAAERGDALTGQPSPRLAQSLLLSGNYERARELYELLVARNLRNTLAVAELSRLASQRGDYEQAIEHARAAEALLGENRGGSAILGYAYHLAGSQSDADRIYNLLQDAGPANEDSGYALMGAISQLSVGRTEEALQLLERVAIAKYNYALTDTAIMVVNAFDDPVLEQPEFVEVRKKLGFRIN